MDQQAAINELTFLQPFGAPEKQLLTPAAVDFLTALVEQFAEYCDVLLNARVERQCQIDQGILPNFMTETISIRKDDWKIQGIPADLLDRRVEITGPVERVVV
ncbi:hypothetical protein QE197_18020 [Arsenophonus nasoniae]|uniref:Malate synthase A n=1 Tax=Arsenophonus nasoniae TaxID=638 RepID=A0A4V1BXF1_9GAMM|nr:hypothetical protein [Arsenophonus nasoniae]QBY45473.1 Malate synthase A [Arsenophonus nasoniae]WGM05605.1 hypothetical protein QE258_19395 [Arsenophonus nasoniae]WGM10617.1 hypothetical protein QE197_18020 [Arsenophonus nasoniae]WGM15324.1 hypothetical protein QE193_17910 [Arsenophonus nasoniae]